jgi:AraC-like DNA-binding protein
MFHTEKCGHSTIERAEICAHHMAVHGYFRKPIDPDDLLERVMEILHEDKGIKNSAKNLVKPASFNKLSDPVKRAIEFINSHYTEPIGPKDVANHICGKVCVSKKYLGKKFKRELGCRMDEYINSLRVDEAIKLLSENREMRPSRMWERLGLRDICDFFRCFKRRTGFTPSAYRKRYGKS